MLASALARYAARWKETGEVPVGYFQISVKNKWMQQFIELGVLHFAERAPGSEAFNDEDFAFPVIRLENGAVDQHG